MSKGRLRVAATLGVLLVFGVDGTTGATWSDADTITGTTIKTGRLDVKVNGLDAVTGYAPLDVSGLVPGTSAAAVLTVSNAGNVPLAYTVSTTGTNADGKGLFAALARKVTADAAVTPAASGGTCAGTPLVGATTVAAAASGKVCVEVSLPPTAPASLAGAATDLTITVDSTVSNAWTDSGDVTGTQLTAITPTAPTMTCGAAALGSITVSWNAVSGATGYRIHYGTLGGTVEDVPASTLNKSFVGVSGLASVQAIFGSATWISASSNTRTYSALTGVLGTCS